MRIVEGILASGRHVWIVHESEVDGKEIEAGFATKSEASTYRDAVVALRRARRQAPDDKALIAGLSSKIEHLRRSAIITYGHDREWSHQMIEGFALEANPNG
jgi:hypothetical protein